MEQGPNSLLMSCSLAVLIISVLILSTFEGMNKEEEKPVVDLAICILSARNNVDLRDSIRQSWLSDIEKMARPDGKQWSISAKFVIGSNSCDIHPDNRVSTYNCNRWNFSLPADPSKELVLFSAMPSQVGGRRNIVSSYMIKTMHSITLKRVGILELFPFDKIPKSANIVLYDSASQEEIGRTKFAHNVKGNLINGYYYKSMEELDLPKVGLFYSYNYG